MIALTFWWVGKKATIELSSHSHNRVLSSQKSNYLCSKRPKRFNRGLMSSYVHVSILSVLAFNNKTRDCAALMILTPVHVREKTEDAREAKALDFSKMQITQVEDISFCISLRKLNLSGNAIRSSKLVATLRHLPSLTWLDLSGNKLAEMDGVCQIQSLNGKRYLGNLIFAVLNVSKNQITVISNRILTMVNLFALIATDNQIKCIPALPQSLDTIGRRCFFDKKAYW